MIYMDICVTSMSPAGLGSVHEVPVSILCGAYAAPWCSFLRAVVSSATVALSAACPVVVSSIRETATI